MDLVKDADNDTANDCAKDQAKNLKTMTSEALP